MECIKTWVLVLLLIQILAVSAIAGVVVPGVGVGGGGGGGSGSGTVSPGTSGNTPVYTGASPSTTVGDTGVPWPPTLDQLRTPSVNNYSMGGFFTPLDLGTYQLIGAPLVYGSLNEQLGGLTSPRLVKTVYCESQNLGATTIATISSDAGGPFVTLNAALSSVPDAGTALNDTTKTVIAQIVTPLASQVNTTTKLYLSSTSGLATTDAVSTGTSIYCVPPSGVQANDELIIGGGLDQTQASFTIPVNAVVAPFLPASNDGKYLQAWAIPITTATQVFYTFSWPTAANGGFFMSDVSDGNIGTPFESATGFGGTNSSVSTSSFAAGANTGVSDLFLTYSLQGTGNTQTLSGTPTQGKGIIENVLYNNNNNVPASACANSGQNAFGYSNAAYNNHLFTDQQWGNGNTQCGGSNCTYQKMIRPSSGGNSDHNLYYTRMSWNSNSTLMLGITSPPSGNGTGNPWIMTLFDQNGCFLKPLYFVTGALNGQAQFNWRVTWSKTNPNIFYTNGSKGSIQLFGTTKSVPVNSNDLYAIHPCATSLTGTSDSECVGNTVYSVDDIYSFTPSLAVGSNYISSNQPTGPTLDEAGGRIGIVTRPTSNSSGDYYFSSLAFSSEPTINTSSLHTFDVTAAIPANYCLISSEVEKIRYTGNGENFQMEGGQGSGSPSCGSNEIDSIVILENDGGGGFTQTMLLATDQNAPWLNGGGHHTWSPTIAGAPGNGYFVYNHVTGLETFSGLTCNSNVSNVATCTTTTANFPVWPSGTHIIVAGVSNGAYNGTFPTTATVGTQSNSVSFQIASNPGAASGGTITDGLQWESHSIGINGTGDVTHLENVRASSAVTVHNYWPWGSTNNGNGTPADWFIEGFAFNNVSQYPTQVITGCTYSGSAPTGTAVCTLANNLPTNWIVPGSGANQGIGSLGASTVFTSGVTDGSTTCYNGMYPITASTATTYSYQPRCTPAASSNANTGTAYVPATDELYKCYRGDATFGNQCFPLARTYSALVSANFFSEPLPNGDALGHFVEFDSAPGTAPAPSFGKSTDAKTLQPLAAPPFNPALFFTYAAITPTGNLQSTGSASWSNMTLALQPVSASAVPMIYTPEGNVSANGARYINGATPAAQGDACVEGSPCGALVPSTMTGSQIITTGDFQSNSTAPTLTAGCNGAGVVQPVGTDAIGSFTGQTAAATTCTLTKSGAACPNVYDCTFTDGGNATPASFATSSGTVSTAVATFASLGAAKVHYSCQCR